MTGLYTVGWRFLLLASHTGQKSRLGYRYGKEARSPADTATVLTAIAEYLTEKPYKNEFTEFAWGSGAEAVRNTVQSERKLRRLRQLPR
jgi:hypothetical protein